jgi:hypothetical protein
MADVRDESKRRERNLALVFTASAVLVSLAVPTLIAWLLGANPLEFLPAQALWATAIAIVGLATIYGKRVSSDVSADPGRAGIAEAGLGMCLAAAGILGLASGDSWHIHVWISYLIAGGAAIALAVMRRSRTAVSIVLGGLFVVAMTFLWGSDLFGGTSGVSGTVIDFGEFVAPFVVMAAIAAARTQPGYTGSLRGVVLTVSVPLLFALLTAFFGLQSGASGLYILAGILAGLAATRVPTLGIALCLGVLAIPVGNEFGWAPWSGAPIDTLSPRLGVLVGAAALLWALAAAASALRKGQRVLALACRLASLLAARRRLALWLILVGLGLWFCYGQAVGFTAAFIPFEPFLPIGLKVLELAIFLYLSFFALSIAIPRAGIKREDDER